MDGYHKHKETQDAAAPLTIAEVQLNEVKQVNCIIHTLEVFQSQLCSVIYHVIGHNSLSMSMLADIWHLSQIDLEINKVLQEYEKKNHVNKK